jgi:hypothetical protein
MATSASEPPVGTNLGTSQSGQVVVMTYAFNQAILFWLDHTY